MPDPIAKYVVLRDPKTNEILIPKTSALDYEVVDSQPVPPYELNVDADTLQGHPASDFQLAGEGPDLSNYYTKAEIDAALGGSIMPIPAPSSHTPGDVITWDNKEWLVCHYDSTNNQVYLIAKDIIGKTAFNSEGIDYSASIFSVIAQNYTNQLSLGALSQCVPVTVNGITAKVFVPSYEQMNGGFSWFNSDANRLAQYNGSNTDYWISSPYDSDYVWLVTDGGAFSHSYPRYSRGFRPCVCVQL